MAELKRYWTSIGELLLRMENNENERRKKYLNNLMIFEGHEVEVFELDGQVLFNPYHVGKCLELGDSAVRKAIGNMTEKQVTKLRNSDVKESNIRKLNNAGENFLTESGVYKLVFRSNKPNAEAFTDWVTDEVLPTIRKTGGYVNNDDLFIATYLPYADESTKLMFKSTLSTVRKQNEIIENQKKEIEHKEDVIIGLVDDISLAEKRQILNRVVRYNHANYRERWSVLYREFENKYHINLQHRFEAYNESHKPKCKGKLDYIDKVMNKVAELYEIATKLFENDIKALVEEMYSAAS